MKSIQLLVFFAFLGNCFGQELDFNKQEVKDLINLSNTKNIISASAVYYPNSANIPLSLGYGFDINDIETPKQAPFNFSLDTIEGGNNMVTSFDFRLVFSKEQLKKSLDIDTKLEARFMFGSANASYRFVEDFSFNSENLVVVMKATSEYGRVRIKDYSLKKKANQIYNGYTSIKTNCYTKRGRTFCDEVPVTHSADLSAFQKVYGNKIPVVMRRGNSLYFILEIQNYSDDLKRKVESSLQASGGIGMFSGSFSFALKEELQRQSTKSSISIHAFTNGGRGYEGYDTLIKTLKESKTSFEDIKGSLGYLLSQQKVETSTALGYFCVNYEDLGLANLKESKNTPEKDKALLEIVNKFHANEKKILVIQRILSDENPSKIMLTESIIGDLETTLKKFSIYQDKLYEKHTEILRNTDYQNGAQITIPSSAALDSYTFPESIDVKATTNITLVKGIDKSKIKRIDLNNPSIVKEFNYEINTPYLKSIRILVLEDRTNKQLNQKDFILTPNQVITRTIPGNVQADLSFNAQNHLVIKSNYFGDYRPGRKLLQQIAKQLASNATQKVNIFLLAENIFGIEQQIPVAYGVLYNAIHSSDGTFFFFPTKKTEVNESKQP